MIESINLIQYIFILYIISILYDVIIGEFPTLIHPVIYIGKLINSLMTIFAKLNKKIIGLIIYLLTVTLIIIITLLLLQIFKFNLILYSIFYCYILKSTFSINLLFNSANEIGKNLNSNQKSKKLLNNLVSRDTSSLNKNEIISATIETLSENVTDSIISPLFYYILFIIILTLTFKNNNLIFLNLSLIAPLIYRISNTLDAMIGYKTTELINIGFFSAKIDDILNFIPSRIAGCLIIMSSFILNYNYINSYKIFKKDSRNCSSPNSGYTMAPTAGALNIQLVKRYYYKIGIEIKKIESNDIFKAIKLCKFATLLFIFLSLVIFQII